jgi:hypothetical protein
LKFEVSLVGTAVDCSFLQDTSVIAERLFSKGEKSHGSRLPSHASSALDHLPPFENDN